MTGINGNIVISIIMTAILYGTPLVFAGIGELFAERSGVLNLGVEGMMLMGAVMGFFVSQEMTGPTWLVLLVAVLVAMAAAAMMSLIHAFITITMRANQIVSGLTLTIFAGAIGLSSYIAEDNKLGGKAGKHQFDQLNLFGAKNIPVIGPILFHQSAMVYLSWLVVIAAVFYLYRTRVGLHLRSVGESPQAADAMGINVIRYRYLHVLLGGALAGAGGAVFTLQIATNWIDGMTAGAGWIAIALVIFSFWRPELLILGAYLFGAFTSVGFDLQARGITSIPSEFWSSLPYLMTVVALVAVSAGSVRRRLGTPAALGIPYVREES
ncbi:MAG TPA: ABC transporter permease [Streptosporangiaceae bacterium]|nr:ABC transporter permease [Streptosporangiaceae bacterium]